jgi:hypothetical protein
MTCKRRQIIYNNTGLTQTLKIKLKIEINHISKYNKYCHTKQKTDVSNFHKA